MNFRIYIKKRLLDGNWSETLCIQDSFLGIKESMLIDPRLTKKKNSAGSFEAGVHQDNIAMTTLDPDGRPWIEKGNTRVFIKAFKNKYESSALESSDGILIWDGRVLSCDTDFYNQPKIYAEGALSYLNDTIQPKEVFQYSSSYQYPCDIFRNIIYNHNEICSGHSLAGNAMVESSMGPVYDLTDRETHNTYHFGREWPAEWVKEQKAETTENASKFSVGEETTMSALTRFIETFGGSVRITYAWRASESRYVRNIEWITEDYDVSKQNDPAMVTFAVNLLDMTRKTDASSVVTAVMPRGYKAYSGGSWAIGDDMFAPVDEWYPRKYDASRPDYEEPQLRKVSRVTWTSGCYIAKDTVGGAVYKWAESPEGSAWHGGQPEQTMATGFLDAGWPYDPDSEIRQDAGWDDFRFRADHNDPSVYPEYEDEDDRFKHANDHGSGAVWTRDGWLRGHALEVTFGEVYFISLEQGDGNVTYVVTAGPLGHMGSFVVDIGTASSAHWPADDKGGEYTKWDHHKLEIKRPTGNFLWGGDRGRVVSYDDALKNVKKLYLNISSRGWYYDWGKDTDNVYARQWKDWDGSTAGIWGHHMGDNPTVQPDPEGKKSIDQLREEQKSFGTGPAGIWKGRKIPDGLDEYITLKGLGDGSYSSYFYTVTTTSTNQYTGSQTSSSKEIVIDCPSQAGKDKETIYYPRFDASKAPSIYQSVDDLPTDVLNDHIRYPKTMIYDEAEKLWTWRAMVTNRNEQKQYVVVETSSGFRRWYEVRAFARNGYFIYDKDAIKRYGRIEKIIDFQDAHNPDYLEEAALQYLYNAKFEEYSLDLTAIDAQLLTEDSDLERVLDVIDPVKTYSTFHGISVILPIEELEIPFNDLGSMSFTLSFSTTQRITSTITAKKR